MRQLTEHDVPGANEDDIEIVCSADVGSSGHDQARSTTGMERPNLSIGISLEGSMDGLREEKPEE